MNRYAALGVTLSHVLVMWLIFGRTWLHIRDQSTVHNAMFTWTAHQLKTCKHVKTTMNIRTACFNPQSKVTMTANHVRIANRTIQAHGCEHGEPSTTTSSKMHYTRPPHYVIHQSKDLCKYSAHAHQTTHNPALPPTESAERIER